MKKLLAERDACSACLREVVTALRRIVRGLEEKKDKAADMLAKVKTFYEKARSRAVSLRAAEVSELQKKIDKLTDEVEGKDLELQALARFKAETAMPR